MSVDISNFQEVFFDEVAENLATIESLLLSIDIGRAIDEDLNAIFRAAHSIKGGAGMFGMTGIAAFTHVMETLLDRLRRHELELTVSHVDAFLEASDVIRAMVGACRGETGTTGATALVKPEDEEEAVVVVVVLVVAMTMEEECLEGAARGSRERWSSSSFRCFMACLWAGFGRRSGCTAASEVSVSTAASGSSPATSAAAMDWSICSSGPKSTSKYEART
jgi:chemotaxis protein histidine kinase CheA